VRQDFEEGLSILKRIVYKHVQEDFTALRYDSLNYKRDLMIQRRFQLEKKKIKQ